MVTAQPHILSNGYQMRFNEKPWQQCKVGYIVPEWIEETAPMLSAIKSINGSDTALPTTTLVLPLKPEKVKAVKDELSSLNPEVLLFLSKIKRLSVREEDPNPKLHTVNTIMSISSVNLKSIDAESYTLHLTANNEEYEHPDGNNVGLVTPISGRNKLLPADCDHVSWLINWNTELVNSKYFLPKVTQEAIQSCSNVPTVVAWLKEEVKVSFVSVYEYAELVSPSVNNSHHKLAVRYAYFVYASSQKKYFWKHQVVNLSGYMPVVDKYGQIIETRRSGVVVPGNGSRWVELIGPNNPWRHHNYAKSFFRFLKLLMFQIYLPRMLLYIPTVSSPLSKRNTFLLLAWVRQLKTSLPERFLSSIKNGSWLKIFINGYGPPSESFMLDSSIGHLVQYASGIVHFHVVDEEFYGEEINNYKDELETIGVSFVDTGAKDNFLWVLNEEEWKAVSEISNIPFIYGDELLSFKDKLGLLGVVINFNQNYQLVLDKVKSRQELGRLSSEAMLLVLRCIRNLPSPDKLVDEICHCRPMKTNLGYMPPKNCYLLNPEFHWVCLLQVFESNPFIDEQIYGRTLKKLQVKVPVDLSNCIREYKWLRTRLGDYRRPNECILFNAEMEQIAPISSQLPFIDDTSSEIHDYHVELNKFGVVTDLKNCSNFLADGLVLPQDCGTLTPATVYILLEYVKELNININILGEKLSKKREKNILGKELFVVQNWYPTTQHTLTNNLLKIPVLNGNGNGIFLFDKRDVIIPDDLFLTDLFLKSSRPPIFAWIPQPSLNSQITRTKLLEVYTKLGVRTLSESARKNIRDHIQIHDADSKEKIINKGLLKLILAFLADSNLKIDPYKRHEAVSRVLALEACESPEICASSLLVAFNKIRCSKKKKRLFMQKMETSSFGHKYVIEYASHFAEEIAEGVLLLCDKEQLVPDLSELIRLGYFVDFDEEAVDFLIKTKNLHICVEDQHYLSSTFNYSKGNLQPKKRWRHDSYELHSTKLPRQTSDPVNQ
ncbi:hypothetical protein L1887_33360 [Cichorium endivia]|nr:hypothetical protein L1887_33360 [Cichorium endivia]